MKKALKFILSFISLIIILLVSVPIILSMLLQVGVIQNFAVDKVTELLSAKAKTVMSISNIDIEFFNRVVIDDAYIEDHRGDTMIYIKKLKVSIDGINFLNGKISLGVVDIIEGGCRLYKDSAGMMNVQSVFDNFKPKVPPPDPPDFRMTVREVNLIDYNFSLNEYNALQKSYGINFQKMDFKKIHFQGRNVEIYNYDVLLGIEHMTFRDRSGFYLQHLSSPRCGVNESGMRFEKLRIETPQSLLQLSHLYLLYDSWYAYNNFVNEVTIDADIALSRLSYRTLSYFIGQPNSIPTTVELKGRVRGTVPNLQGFFTTIRTRDTDMALNFSIVGLPKIEQTKFNMTLEDLTTDADDIAAIYSEVTGKDLGKMIPMLERAANIRARGTFKGRLVNFLAEASIDMKQGQLNGRLSVIPQESTGVRFIGNLRTGEFNLGELLAAGQLGGIAFDAGVDATVNRGAEMAVKANGEVSHLFLAGYDFRGISVDGLFQGKTFEGSVVSRDTNLNFTTTGRFDLTQTIPAYDFKMQLNRANFVALGINRRDSVSELSANFSASGLGDNIDNMNGVTKIEKIVYINHIDTVRAGDVTILSQNSDSLKVMRLNSHFADAELRGSNSYSQILDYLAQSAKKYIPSFPDAEKIIKGYADKKVAPVPMVYSKGSYSLEVNVKQANNVASIFVPGLKIAQQSHLSFLFDPSQDKFRIDLTSDFIGRESESLRQVKLVGRNAADSLMFRLSSSVCEVGSLYMPNFEIRGGVRDNKIGLNVRFNNPVDSTGADLRTITSIYRNERDQPQIKIEILPTLFSIEGEQWNIDPSSFILDSTGVAINDFRLNNREKELYVDGQIGRSIKDVVNVRLKDFDISPVSLLIENLGYQISGIVSGEAKGSALIGDMNFDAMLQFRDVKLNDYALGNPVFVGAWNSELRRVDMEIVDGIGGKPITGYFDVANTRYRADIRFPKFDMVLLEPLLKGILVNTSGEADVDLTLSGGKGTPSLGGSIEVKQYNVKVDYTKAEYSVSGMVDVKNNLFSAHGLTLTDNLKGSGKLDAELNSRYFKDLTFGVNINFTNLLAIKTTVSDNDIFYGKAYATGQFAIKGDERNTTMAINAETALASEFYLPFTGISTIDEAKFITFVNPAKAEQQQEIPRASIRKNISRIQYTNELDIKLNLRVLPNTKAQITANSSFMGNVIEGYGNGNFMMHINPEQDIFTLNGQYEISRGTYQFNLMTIFDKRFNIDAGSTVRWLGDPADPEVTLDATYKVKASIAPLVPDSGLESNININCGINLTGKLFTPDLRLSITAPSADPEMKNILSNALNTEEAVTSQFFSLFTTGTFRPDTGAASIGSMGSSVAGATAFEFLSNQLSNLISSDKFDVRFGYKPRTQNTSDEFSVDFETDIIPNKLSIELGGNYNTGNNPTYNQRAPFTGDAYLTYVINKAQTLRLKGFTRVIERFDETQGLQESGVGVYYRQDFQTLLELRNKIQQTNLEAKKRRLQRREDRQK